MRQDGPAGARSCRTSLCDVNNDISLRFLFVFLFADTFRVAAIKCVCEEACEGVTTDWNRRRYRRRHVERYFVSVIHSRHRIRRVCVFVAAALCVSLT